MNPQKFKTEDFQIQHITNFLHETDIINSKQRAFFDSWLHFEEFQIKLKEIPYYAFPDYLNKCLLKEAQFKKQESSQSIEQQLESWFKEQVAGDLSALRAAEDLLQNGSLLLNKELAQRVLSLAQKIMYTPHDSARVLIAFANRLEEYYHKIHETILFENQTVADFIESVPDRWHRKNTWYYTYADKFIPENMQTGDFDSLCQILPYIKHLGANNLYILPHYETPLGDYGYDISDYVPAERLGGIPAFKRLVSKAAKLGITVTTDLVIGHISSQHNWFQNALKGDPKYCDYFVKAPRTRNDINIDEVIQTKECISTLYFTDSGDSGEPVETSRRLVFPDFSKSNWVPQTVKGLSEPVLFNYTFYPFQMDLNIHNPDVIDEFFNIMGNDILMGVMGIRVDAPQFTCKKIGGGNENEPESKAYFSLLSLFRHSLNPKSMVLPEIYGFDDTDAIFETGYYFGIKHAAIMGNFNLFFDKFGSSLNLGKQYGYQTVIVPGENHDDAETISFGMEEFNKLLSKTKSNPAFMYYKNDLAYTGRIFNLLGNSVPKLMNYYAILFSLPGIPSLYFGSELGAENDFELVSKRQLAQFEIISKLTENSGTTNINLENCKDPRELHRGSIPINQIQERLNKPWPPVAFIHEMNSWRSLNPMLSSLNAHRLQVFNSDNESMPDMFSIIRIEDGTELTRNCKPIVLIVNFSNKTRSVSIKSQDIQEILGQFFRGRINWVYSFTFSENEQMTIEQNLISDAKEDGIINLSFEPYQVLAGEI